MSKKVLILNANPSKKSFSTALANQYMEGCKYSKADVELVYLIDLNFDLILHNGYKQKQEQESDLKDIRQKIKDCDHLVIIYPTWWGTYPALLKGFIDRVFVPGFAFKYREKSLRWDKLLKGKTARIITTMDTPKWYCKLVYKCSGIISLKKAVLKFSGFSTVKTSIFTPIKRSTELTRKIWLKRVFEYGKKMI